MRGRLIQAVVPARSAGTAVGGQPQPLVRAYRVGRLVAVGALAVAAVLGSLTALGLTINKSWTATHTALSVVAAALVLLLGLPLVVILVLYRDSSRTASFYRSKAKDLDDAVSELERLAYTDSITGIPNSRALEEELKRTSDTDERCLIFLDLRNFGSINKHFSHWAGDEYLREFSSMVVRASRRNERLHQRTEHEPDRFRPRAFRKSDGSDEFFILLLGPLLDGIGYLNRLMMRRDEFEEMSRRILGEVHPFGFAAGLTNVARDESYWSAVARVSQCLNTVHDPSYELWIRWSPELPSYDPGSHRGQMARNAVSQAKSRFSKTAQPA